MKILKIAIIVCALAIFSFGVFVIIKRGVHRDRIEKAYPFAPAQARLKEYKSKQGFSFVYSQKIFELSETENEVLLKSPYYVNENYKGAPDGEFKHPFAIKMYAQPGTIEEGIKSMIDEHPEYADDVKKTLADDTVELTDFYNFRKITVAGVSGVSYVTGIEGTNVWHIELPKSSAELLKIEASLFTDFLKDNVRPTPFSEAAERAEVEKILKSLEFSK